MKTCRCDSADCTEAQMQATASMAINVTIALWDCMVRHLAV